MTDPRPTILLVEDEVIIRLGAVDLLEDAGFEVLEAPNADVAIKILEQRPDIRLVFTDVDIGTMDGGKLTHYIRHRWPPIQLIVTSGKTFIREKDLPASARFFGKPYAEHSIVTTMHEMIRAADGTGAAAAVR